MVFKGHTKRVLIKSLRRQRQGVNRSDHVLPNYGTLNICNFNKTRSIICSRGAKRVHAEYEKTTP